MTTPEGEASSARLGLAAVAACTSAALLYALVRLAQSLLSRDPDPARVLWSEHTGYFWRIAIAGYTGVMVGFYVWAATGRDAARTARVLAKATVIAAIVLALQALCVP